jgi:hypothetical protein
MYQRFQSTNLIDFHFLNELEDTHLALYMKKQTSRMASEIELRKIALVRMRFKREVIASNSLNLIGIFLVHKVSS